MKKSDIDKYVIKADSGYYSEDGWKLSVYLADAYSKKKINEIFKKLRSKNKEIVKVSDILEISYYLVGTTLKTCLARKGKSDSLKEALREHKLQTKKNIEYFLENIKNLKDEIKSYEKEIAKERRDLKILSTKYKGIK
jgi:uncharacterized protein involved in exopolysaccharide biosynthesis